MQLPAPKLITTPNQLNDLAQRLLESSRIAVDTESNSLHAYQEQVCLIQFSIPDGDFLVDPIANPDLKPLAGVFASPQVETVFHAAEYDVICLKRDFNFTFHNLFDTQIAARILGWRKVGLGNILEDRFGLKLNKKFQRANWKDRPLSDEMMRYAQLDTHFLLELRDQLEELLIEADLIDLAREDFRRMCEVSGSPPVSKDQLCWRVSGSHELTPQQMAVLQELCLFRDRIAEKLDRPHFKVFGDRTLVEISRHCPFDPNELRGVKGLQHWQIRKYGRDLLAAVQRGLKAEPLEPERSQRPPASYFARMDAIHSWRKETARSLGVESDIVLPRDLMETVVRENPKNEQDLAGVLADTPWRMAHFGEKILTVLDRSNHRN